jgi:AcrR family transcriptional regulator
MPTLDTTLPARPIAVRGGRDSLAYAGSHNRFQVVSGGTAGTVEAGSRVRPASGEDRRITRSRAALRSALVELMEEQGLESITVNDLCARAGLTRGTFYNHYPDKDALLEACEDEILADLAEFEKRLGALGVKDVLPYIVAKRPLPFLVDIFDYLRTQGDFLHAALGSGGDVRFAPRLRDSLCTQIVESVLHEQYRDNPTAFVGYYVAFFASAYLGVISRWIETGMVESSEEMALISQRLLFIKPGESIKL